MPTNAQTQEELAAAEARNNARRGNENVTDEDDREGELPAQAMMRAIQREMRGEGAGWSYAASYAAKHKGAVSGAAIAADKNRASEQRRAAQREFARRTGMTEYEYNQLQKYKAINEANRKNFVAQARAGKFQGNIYLSGQNWKDLAASVDKNGNLSETVDLSEKGKNGEAMKLLNAWAKAINDPNAARYGGRYNMNALPKGIFIQGADGTWKVNESMITSQAQLNGLVQMMRQDDARQGAGKAAQAQRQKQTDDKNREFLKSQGVENVDKMDSDQLAAQTGAIRQEIVNKTVEEYRNADPNDPYAVTADDVTREMQAAGKTATEINRAIGRPDSIKEGAAPREDLPRMDLNVDVPTTVVEGKNKRGEPTTQMVVGQPTFTTDNGVVVNEYDTRDLEPEEPEPAKPREDTQSPKTDQSPKVDEEGK